MGRIVRRCDPCGSDWKRMITELWERYQNVVRGVKFGNQDISYPDGDGIITVDTSGLVDVDDTLDDDSENPVQNKVIAEAVESLEAEDASLSGRIGSNATAINGLQTRATALENSIIALEVEDQTLDGKILAVQQDNATTRGIALDAKQTADSFESRLEDVESSDATQTGQIATLQAEDLRNAKLDGDNVFSSSNSFAVNPKGANPASGATDTSLVNANWASQTGRGRPNNLIHETGVESFMADKTFGSDTSPDVASLIIWSSGAYRRLRFRSSVDDKTVTPETPIRYGLLNYSDMNDQTVCNFQLEHKTTGGYKLTVTLKKSDGTDQTITIGETS